MIHGTLVEEVEHFPDVPAVLAQVLKRGLMMLERTESPEHSYSARAVCRAILLRFACMREGRREGNTEVQKMTWADGRF